MLCSSLAQELWLKRWKRMIVVRADFISLPLCFFFFSLLISCLPSPLRFLLVCLCSPLWSLQYFDFNQLIVKEPNEKRARVIRKLLFSAAFFQPFPLFGMRMHAAFIREEGERVSKKKVTRLRHTVDTQLSTPCAPCADEASSSSMFIVQCH